MLSNYLLRPLILNNKLTTVPRIVGKHVMFGRIPTVPKGSTVTPHCVVVTSFLFDASTDRVLSVGSDAKHRRAVRLFKDFFSVNTYIIILFNPKLC